MNGLEVLSGETCVNCGSEVWKTNDVYNVVCSSDTCGIVQVRQSSEYASIYECISCNTRDSTWVNDPPYESDDPDPKDCPPTGGRHDWMLIRHSTVDLTKPNDR